MPTAGGTGRPCVQGRWHCLLRPPPVPGLSKPSTHLLLASPPQGPALCPRVEAPGWAAPLSTRPVRAVLGARRECSSPGQLQDPECLLPAWVTLGCLQDR